VKTERPPILYGAVALAVLSLAWSGYAITDLMHSGRFGLSVALAGDIGWITVLWAEYKGVTIGGWNWAAVAAGWAIALGVAALLVIHGQEAGGRAQAIAGPFVVLVGKIVWAFALAAMKDHTALTPEQQAEINAVIRDSKHAARLKHAEADGEIAGIEAEARTTLARDEADFQIHLERVRKRAEIDRRTPLALPPGPSASSSDRVAEQPIEVAQDTASGRPDTRPDRTPDMSGQPDTPSGHDTEHPDTETTTPPATSTDTRPDTTDVLSAIASAASGPADLVKALAAHGVPAPDLVSEAVRLRPDMVADSIRRTAKRFQAAADGGPYR
jgi:hypothetical protein